MYSINFITKDKSHSQLNRRAYNVIYEVINNKDKKYILDGFLDCIINNSRLNSLSTDFSTWKEKYNRDPFKSNKQKLITCLEDYLLVNNIDQDSYSIKRGYIFELFLYEIMKNRYGHARAKKGRGCNVVINGNSISNGERQTVDFAGWDYNLEKGEFYEAKIRPSTFDESTIIFLNYMRNELDTYETTNLKFLLGCISMFSKRDLKRELKMLETSINENIKLFGKEDLLELENPQI